MPASRHKNPLRNEERVISRREKPRNEAGGGWLGAHGLVIGEHHDGVDRQVVLLQEAREVAQHPPPKLHLRGALVLDMDQKEGFPIGKAHSGDNIGLILVAIEETDEDFFVQKDDGVAIHDSGKLGKEQLDKLDEKRRE